MVHRIDQSHIKSRETNGITNIFVETKPRIIEFKGGVDGDFKVMEFVFVMGG